MSLDRFISVLSIVCCVSFSSQALAGIPVTIDADIPGTANHIETIAKWKLQYDQMVSQIDQLKTTYDSMTGSRGMGQIFNNEDLKTYLPNDWQEVYDKVRDGGYEGLTGTAKSVYESNQVFDACASLTIDEQRLACEARAVKPAQDKGFALDAYEKAKNRLSQIDQLMAKIDDTTDPKEIGELQARIASEQNMIANEQTKLKLYQMVAEAEDRVQQQRKREINAKANARRGWVQPEPIEFGE